VVLARLDSTALGKNRISIRHRCDSTAADIDSASSGGLEEESDGLARPPGARWARVARSWSGQRDRS
jgi:hypothetical protein